jgi:diguanylate cyclase (GGDEF)-like protein
MNVARSRTLVIMTAVGAWLVALGGMLALTWGAEVPRWATNVAALCSALAAVYGWSILSQRSAPPARELVPGLLAIAMAPITWLAAASGGAGSPAVVALALGVRIIAGTEDIRSAIWVSAGALIAISAIDMSVGGSVTMAECVAAAVIFASISVFPAWQSQRAQEQKRRRRSVTSTSLQLAVTQTPSRPLEGMPSDLRRGVEASLQEVEERRQTEVLHRHLRDLRDTTGADEVIFWRWTAARDTLVPMACSTEIEPEPTQFNFPEWMPLVKWSADERLVHFDEGQPAPRIAVAPITAEKQSYLSVGAITLTQAKGLSRSREELKSWMPRYASQVGLLAELLATREEVGRQNRRTQALLHAASSFQSNRSLDSLGRSVCDTALSVTSASRAALIRWHSASNDGEVQSVSEGHPISQGWPISEDSHVGAMCRNGLPQVWEDARMISRGSRVYGAWESPRSIGSLAIIPLKRDTNVIGAIVIEGDEPGDVLIAEMRNVRLLAAMAAVSLETLWEIEEVSRRARTDQLTGLHNRRHFDEELGRVLAECDRFGGSVALVVADIDFFKKVNDTYGHEGGDAVLRQVAQTFGEGVRQVDVCARYGGEEIAVLLRQTGIDGGREFAERLRKAVETRSIRFSGREIPITASFGVSCYPDAARTHDALFPSADRALYQAKAEGRNRVRCASVATAGRAT